LAAHLAGVTEMGTSSAEPLRRALLENFVLQNPMAALAPHLVGVRFHFWHEQGRQELDFVIEHGRQVLAVEVKATSRLQMDDARSLRAFMRRTPAAVAGVLAYLGQQAVPLGDKLWAVPLHELLA
jgi:predicted AAA+ superfamily ATPase